MGMSRFSSRALKLTVAGICTALLLAVTVNVVADFWTPRTELKEPASPIKESAMQIAPMQPQTAPQIAPLNEQQVSAPAQWQWNEPLFEPKFDFSPTDRRGSAFTIDFNRATNPNAILPQVLPPALPNSDPSPAISFRPIFGSKAGGVGGVATDLPSVGGTTSGAAATAGSLLKR
jgi:hypothetical protein